MVNLFSILNMGRDAMTTQQKGLSVTQHNIANANTPGYSRQRAILGTTDPLNIAGLDAADRAGQYGTGVEVKYVQRIRDMFLDDQIQGAIQDLAEWQAKEDGLSQIENIFLELAETALNDDLDKFWDAWHMLSQDPTSLSLRNDVLQKGTNVANTINRIGEELETLRRTVDATLELEIDHANSLAEQIAALNVEIMQVEANNMNANDLRDQRQLLVEELSEIVDIQTSENEKGALTVSLNEVNMVQDGSTIKLGIRYDENGEKIVVWKSLDDNEIPDFLRAHLEGGRLGGIMEVRNSIIPHYQQKLEDFRQVLHDEVNAIHSTGYDLAGSTGADFFTINLTSNTLEVALGSATQVAAAGAGLGEGDNSIAVALGQLRDVINPHYVRLVGEYGEELQNASMMVDLKTSVKAQLEEKRQSVSGVSLDEEMTNMVKFQHAYQAAARLITAVDEMLDTVINRMGVVGR